MHTINPLATLPTKTLNAVVLARYRDWMIVWEQTGTKFKVIEWGRGTTVVELSQPAPTHTVIALPWFRHLAVSLTNHSVVLWDTASVWELSGFAIVERIEFPCTQTAIVGQEDLSHLVTGGADGTLCLWAVGKGMKPTLSSKQTLHTESIRDMVDDVTLNSLFTSSMDMTIRMWDRTNLAPRRKFGGPTKGVHSLIYSPNLRTIVCASTETVLTVFTPFMEKSLFKMTGHAVPVSGRRKRIVHLRIHSVGYRIMKLVVCVCVCV